MIDSEADPRSRSSESFKQFTEYAPSHASSLYIYIYIYIYIMTMFCKQKEFNFEIIFVPIVEHDFFFLIFYCKRHKMPPLVKCIFCKRIALNL